MSQNDVMIDKGLNTRLQNFALITSFFFFFFADTPQLQRASFHDYILSISVNLLAQMLYCRSRKVNVVVQKDVR